MKFSPSSPFPVRAAAGLSDTLSGGDLGTHGRMRITLDDAEQILRWLSRHALFSSSEPKRDDLRRGSTLNFPHSSPSLGSFVETELRGILTGKGKKIGSKAARDVFWVEVVNVSHRDLAAVKGETRVESSGKQPVKFSLHRSRFFATSLPPTADSSIDPVEHDAAEEHSDRINGSPFRVSYAVRRKLRMDFKLHYTGRNCVPVLSMACDRASFEMNPIAKYHAESEKNPADSLSYLAMFLLAPLQELYRFMSGDLGREFPIEEEPPSQFEAPLIQHSLVFKPVGKEKPFKFLDPDNLSLGRDLSNPYLSEMMMDNLSVSTHTVFNENFMKQALGTGHNVPLSPDEPVQDFLLRMVAMQYHTFTSIRAFGAKVISHAHLEVKPHWDKRKALTSLQDRSDDAEAVEHIKDLMYSHETQHLVGVTITVKDPVSANSKYSLYLGVLDADNVSKQLNEFNEYDRTIEANRAVGVTIASPEQLVRRVRETLVSTLTIHSRVLRDRSSGSLTLDEGVAGLTASALVDRVRAEYNGEVDAYYKEHWRRASSEINLLYWNRREIWGKAVHATPKKFISFIRSQLDPEAPENVAHFEEMTASRVVAVGRIPERLARHDTSLKRELRALFKIEERRVGKHRNVTTRIWAVPELSVALLAIWHMHPSENVFTLLKGLDLMPDGWAEAYSSKRRARDSEGREQQRALMKLSRECREFALSNFGIDIRFPRAFQAKVALNQDEALYDSTPSQTTLSEVFDPEDVSVDFAKDPRLEASRALICSFFGRFTSGSLILTASTASRRQRQRQTT